MNGDLPPIDQETRDHEQITPPPQTTIGQGFAANDSFAERRNALFAELCVICPGADVTAREIMEAIELLARRIAIDLLASKEFSDRILTAQKAFVFALTKTARFKAAVGEIASNMDGQSVPILLNCDEFKQKIRAIVDERMTLNCHETIEEILAQRPPKLRRSVLDDKDTGT